MGKDTGRPTKYKKEYAEQAAKLCRLGAIDTDLADFFNVAKSTINKWKKDYPKFSDSLKESKDYLDNKVERSLYERAVGYEHPEDKIFNNNGKKLIVPTTKHYPPETVAAIFWLKNRQPDKWKDIKEVELSGNKEKPVLVSITEIMGTDESSS